MSKKIYYLLSIVSVFFMSSLNAEQISVNEGLFRTTYESVVLPENEKMGLMGINYLMTNTMGLYYGIGIYGALQGERGGFFTGGVELGYTSSIYKDLLLDVGVFAGGGGGGAAPQGGGLMLRPHITLGYDLEDVKLGLGYSKVLFANGDIHSNQLFLQAEVSFDQVTTDISDATVLQETLQHHVLPYNFTWNRHYLALTIEEYFPFKGTKSTAGKEDIEQIHLVGFEYGSYLNRDWFGFLEAAGAMHGGAGGYAEVLGGMGYSHSLVRVVDVKVKVSVGAAGGGQVDTGGGLVYKTNLGLTYTPIDTLNITTEGGYMGAVNGSFKAYALKLSLGYPLTFLGVGKKSGEIGIFENITYGEWGFRLVNQFYFPSESLRYNQDDTLVSLIGLKIDRFVTQNIYLSGQAYAAYTGDVGGYASGLVGIGYRTHEMIKKASFYGEVLGGAGAGGGIDSGSGAIVQPMVGMNYKFTKKLNMQLGVGPLYALTGALKTVVADIGLLYTFGTIEQ